MIAASHTFQEDEHHLRLLFRRLADYELLVNVKKYVYGDPELNFLRQVKTAVGIGPLIFQVQARHDFPSSITQRSLRECLGLDNFHGRFIPRYAALQRPLKCCCRLQEKTPPPWK